MIKLFGNGKKRLGIIKLIYELQKRIIVRLSERKQEQIKIKKLKKLLKVERSKIKEWKKTGKLKVILDELEIIEFYIQLKQSIKEDEEYENQLQNNEASSIDMMVYGEKPIDDGIKKLLICYFFVLCWVIIILYVWY